MELLALARDRHAARLVDGAIVGVLLVVGVIGAWPVALRPDRLTPDGWVNAAAPVVLAVAVALPLWWRRRWPLLTASAAALGLAVGQLVSREVATAQVGLFIAVYSVGRYAVPYGASIAVLLGVVALEGAFALRESGPTEWLLFVILVTVGLWSLGDAGRRDELRADELQAKAARLEADRRDAEARAAERERTRIARDIHDVIAHSMTVIVVQAGAAARVLDASPDETRESLAVIERTGRDALVEVRRLLGVLHRDDDTAAEPLPTLARLDALVAAMASAGLPVEVSTTGRVAALPAGVDVSAYRVIQEALTNALRHAPGSRATLALDYAVDALRVSVVTTPGSAGVRAPSAGGPASGHAPGHGIAGMRARVALLDGDLRVGPLDGGGFEVRARLPLPAG